MYRDLILEVCNYIEQNDLCLVKNISRKCLNVVDMYNDTYWKYFTYNCTKLSEYDGQLFIITQSNKIRLGLLEHRELLSKIMLCYPIQYYTNCIKELIRYIIEHKQIYNMYLVEQILYRDRYEFRVYRSIINFVKKIDINKKIYYDLLINSYLCGCGHKLCCYYGKSIDRELQYLKCKITKDKDWQYYVEDAYCGCGKTIFYHMLMK
jgi:hypothetical protein